MKIIFTNRFEKEYLKSLIKYLDKKSLAKNLKEKNHNLISIHFPYFKLKTKIKLVNLRWIVAIINNSNIIPLIIYLKKDKKHWENINWTNYEKQILEEYDNALKDIENWDYETY